MKRVLGTLLLLLLCLAGVLAFNTLRLSAAHQAPARGFMALDEAALAERLAGAIRIPTISWGERERNDPVQLERLQAYLKQHFPRVHKELSLEVVNGHSLLYTWTGADPRAKAVLLLGHQDVVPVEPGTEGKWLHAPFSGDIADGFVWGRGTLDDKVAVLGVLEAAELLLANGFHPARTFYFAFGHDEEIGGREGAVKIAELLEQRDARIEFSLDEGGAITLGVVPSVTRPVASIMASEKGYVSFRLTARAAGGHSSLPPRVTAIGELSRAVSRVEDAPLPARLAPPVTDMLARLVPELPPAQRVIMANRWLFAPLVLAKFEAGTVTNALVRTTTAPTIIHAGIKDNVLPSEAYAIVNFRLLPGDTVESVAAHIARAVGDADIEIAVEGQPALPTPVSDPGARGFRLIETTVNEVFPEALVTTGLFIAQADARHYARVRDNGYYFLPLSYHQQDLDRVHGSNERIGVHDYSRAVQFYARLMMNAGV